MQRREFITLLGGAAAWPLAVRAQQAERMRRVGVLEGLPDDAYLAAFLQGMQQLGWADGHNVRIDTRWGAGNVDDIRKYAAELLALAPDVMLAVGTPAVGGCCKRRTPCQSCFYGSLTQSVPASSLASRGRAALLLGFPYPHTASAGNGWSYSRPSRRV